MPQVGPLGILPEEPGLSPSAHMIAHSSYRGADAFFWPPWVPEIHVVNRHVGKTYTK